MPAHDTGYLQMILLLLFILIAVLFLLTQQNTLKELKPENRTMQTGMVWLQLITLFGQIWQFWVVIRIAGSIRREKEFQEGDSILGSSDLQVVERLSKLPTLAFGIACWIIYWVRLAQSRKILVRGAA